MSSSNDWTTPGEPHHVEKGGISARRIVFIVLTALSVGGIAIMEFRDTHALTYWLVTAAIFGVTSIVMAWMDAGGGGASSSRQVSRQILHWATLVVALLLVFLFERAVGLPSTSAGMVALLLLATTTTLAGIHFDWQLALLGVVLMATFATAVLAEQFFFVALLLLVVVAGVVLVRGRRA